MSVLDDLSAIISDDEIKEVHGYANFGKHSPRYVVNEGVLKSAFGYHHGYTALSILREHGLVKSDGCLTKKGFRYLRALHCFAAAKTAIPGKPS